MKEKERRDVRRVPIKVLVQCLPPGIPAQRNGHPAKGWEMWANNIADDGVGLHWSRQWAVFRCPHCLKGKSNLSRGREMCLCTPPENFLKKGQEVQLDGLIYTEKGSKPMKGQIRWIRPGRKGNTLDVGVFVTSRDHRSYFRTLEHIN